MFLGKSVGGLSTKGRSDIGSLLRMGGLDKLPEKVEVPSLSSFVQFLQTNVGANILSTPQVMALDHQKATVSIVEKIPQVSSRTTSVSNANFAGLSITSTDVETALNITPHINPDVNSIRLEIEQKIDDIVPSSNVPEELRASNKAIKKRVIKTFITLRDKETAVLGGLVRETNITNDSKIPILGDLPLIGWLFKNTERDRKKTHLVVFITPHIIRSAKEHKAILSQKLKERMNFIRKFTGNKDPYKDLTDKLLNTDTKALSEPVPEPVLTDTNFSEEEEDYYEFAPEDISSSDEVKGSPAL